MIEEITKNQQLPFSWIDLTDPSKEELQGVAKKYELHESSVEDSLQPDHLPKFERLKSYTFIILRIYTSDKDPEADTMQEITDKIAIFLRNDLIITIHRKPWPILETIPKELINTGDCKSSLHLFHEIIRAVLKSYDDPAKKLLASLEYFEKQIFLKNRKIPILKGLYYLKRKADVMRRVLMLSFDIIDQVDPEGNSDTFTRDIRDLYVKQQNLFDSLSENTNHLLNVYFNVSAQKTNEIVRVLTLFSVFFLPLTFIVGIYGMNFKFMPELNWKLGYPAAFALMAVVTITIYIWFKKKRWL